LAKLAKKRRKRIIPLGLMVVLQKKVQGRKK
jgi:hypothetical protein